ncbi:MAG TPA: lipid-A-disaccharide synthase, partial [Coleofasciculaceae cyanobacterium]
WVRPVVRALRDRLGEDRSAVRLSVVLAPCPNATGNEAQVARSFPEVDRVQGAESFWPFLLWGRTAEHWDWHDRGVVLFLGGDQFFAVAIARRLGYRTVIYAEWEARWLGWVDRVGLRLPRMAAQLPDRHAAMVSVVGDLMLEAGAEVGGRSGDRDRVGLLPGSKSAKLSQGVPLLLATACEIRRSRPETEFVIPVAPTIDLATLVRYADRAQNPMVDRFQGPTVRLVMPAGSIDSAPNPANLAGLPYLETADGTRIWLWGRSPAWDLLKTCDLCLTTVGANTAELGALARPMLVLLPTQQLDAMRAWNGIPGILANLPGVGSALARLINRLALRRLGMLAWPNIWAGEAIVPELLGNLTPRDVADRAIDLLANPAQLAAMGDRLRAVRGEPGAARKLAEIVAELMATEGIVA